MSRAGLCPACLTERPGGLLDGYCADVDGCREDAPQLDLAAERQQIAAWNAAAIERSRAAVDSHRARGRVHR